VSRAPRGAARRGAALAALLVLTGCAAPAGDRGTTTPSAVETPAAAGPTAAAVAPLPDLGPGTHELTVAGEDALVRVPERPNGRLVVYAHGVEARATALLNDEAFGALADGLVAAGYVVAASDAAGDAWGDAASVDAHAALATAVTGVAGSREVYLVAESMGGLAGAQLVTGRRIPGLRAYAGISPLCDLGSARRDYGDSIEAAHGPAVDEAVARLSPVRLEAAVPVRFWASAEDVTVPRRDNADVCAAQVVDGGGRADVVPARGGHGDPSTYDLAGLLAFFDDAAA
jgi:alpha-beta hydrolase superfamily lysophospholipase